MINKNFLKKKKNTSRGSLVKCFFVEGKN